MVSALEGSVRARTEIIDAIEHCVADGRSRTVEFGPETVVVEWTRNHVQAVWRGKLLHNLPMGAYLD